MTQTITSLEDGLVKIEDSRGVHIGLSSNLSARVLRSVDIGKLQSRAGWILDTSGGMTPWKIEGVLEHQGKIFFYGPWVSGKTASAGDLTLQDLCLLGKIFFLAAEKKLPLEGFFTRGWYFLKDRKILVFPPELMDFIRKNQTEPVKESCWYPFNYPGVKGTEGLGFTLAVLAYRVFTGTLPFSSRTGDDLAEEMRTQKIIPPRYRCPGLKKEVSDFLEEILNNKETGVPLHRWLSYLESWEKEDPRKKADEQEKTAMEKELKDLEEKRRARIKIHGFWKKKRNILITLLITTVLVGAFLSAPLKKALAPPLTMGFTPYEVVEAYYNSFETLDQDMMEDCIDRKIGKPDIQEVMNFYVTSRVRQGYEGNTGMISAREWTASGRPLPEPGITVFGIVHLKIVPLMENRFQASYEKWYPGVPAEDSSGSLKGVYPRGYRVRDMLELRQQKKGNWVIQTMNRSIQEIKSYSSDT